MPWRSWSRRKCHSGPVNTIADIFQDEHVRARGNIVAVPDPVHEAAYVPGVVPLLSATPGAIYSVAPEIGEHNREICQGLLGLSDDELEQLRAAGAI